MSPRARPVAIRVDPDTTVSAILDDPGRAFAFLVLAHGAGAGMTHPFMAAAAQALSRRGVAVLRFQFPAMERGSRRPDRPALAQAAVRAAVAAAARRAGGRPLFAGGKSFGGRMTSQAQAEAPLDRVRGLVFLGFPLHAARRPSAARAAHLARISIPMLFVQGDRDALAEPALLASCLDRLSPRPALHAIQGADHGFHVPRRSGRTDDDVLADLADAVADSMRAIADEDG